MRDETKIIQFGFQELSNIKRPFTGLSNNSNRLNSSIDLKVEYVNQNVVPAKVMLKNSYIENEKRLRLLQNEKQLKRTEIIKSNSSMGFRKNDNDNSEKYFKNLDKSTREAFPEKLISKESCKLYLKNLRWKQEEEKNRIRSIAEGMKGENKCKFEYHLKHKFNNPVTVSATKSYRNVLKDAFEEKTILQKDVRTEVFPKLLNSIRMTNFSNASMVRKAETKELQRQASREKNLRPIIISDENPRASTAIKFKNYPDPIILSSSDNSQLVSERSFLSENFSVTELQKKIPIVVCDIVNNSQSKIQKLVLIFILRIIIIFNEKYFSESEIDINEFSGSAFEDSSSSFTASSLNSVEKNRFKTKWPTVEEIEKILGFRIRPPTPPPPPVVIVPAEVLAEVNKKGKKSDGKKKEPVKANIKSGSEKSPKSSARGILKSDRSNSGNKQSKNVEIAKPEESKHVQIVIEPPTQIEPIKETPRAPIIMSEEIQDIIIDLPKTLCPSSLKFSKKLGVKNWIENSQFELSNRTKPLI